MEVGYLVFVYEPFSKYNEVVRTPFYTRNADDLVRYIKEVKLRRSLFYIDIFRTGEGLALANVDNEITDKELDSLMVNLSLHK
jgi:hypothetical protein